MIENKTILTIEDYIEAFPPEIQERLRSIRAAIRAAAPEASEKISWNMPTFFQNGNLVHFAAHKKHIGLYPGPEAIETFQDRLTAYRCSKGAIQFPHNAPLPLDLIEEIVCYRAAANTK